MVYTPELIAQKTLYSANMNPDVTVLGTTSKNLLATYIDDAQQDLAEILLKHRPDLLSYYFDLTLTGASSYYIPDSIVFDYENILMCEDITNSDSPLQTIPADWRDRMNYRDGTIQSGKTTWAIRDQNIEFVDDSFPTSGTYRFWYTRRPVGLFYGTAGGGTSTTIIFPTSPTLGQVNVVTNDYYNGMCVRCNNQTKLITDYVASTYTATISGTWATTPLNTHTVYLMSPLPERLHSIIPEVAASKLKVLNDDDATQLRNMIDERMQVYISRIERPQTQSPEYVRRIPRVY
jgi:hypothetical protein